MMSLKDFLRLKRMHRLPFLRSGTFSVTNLRGCVPIGIPLPFVVVALVAGVLVTWYEEVGLALVVFVATLRFNCRRRCVDCKGGVAWLS